jgi:hypothetical protein
MRLKVEVAGFEGRAVEIEAGLFRKSLFVDGHPAPKGPKLGQYALRRNDGREVVAKWQASLDPAPQINVDGQTFRTAPPLRWYEWVAVGTPLVMIGIGGALGGLLGGLAAMVNAQIVRSQLPAPIRYAACAGVIALAFGTYVLVAGALHIAMQR